MKVYAHFKFDNEHKDKKEKIEFRWRTLLQFGNQDTLNAWKVIGSVYLKNPGSAYPMPETPITASLVTSYLQKFDAVNYEWYEFRQDDTMECIQSLFQEYYGTPLCGVVQIFNLFNLRSPSLEKAHKTMKEITNPLLYSFDDDIKYLKQYDVPIYLGWGNEWKKHQEIHKNEIASIFECTKNGKHGNYLSSNFYENKFFHPRFLYRFGETSEKRAVRLAFSNKSTS